MNENGTYFLGFNFDAGIVLSAANLPVMADGVVLGVRDALVFTTESTERTKIECQCCAGLKVELNKITMKLESATKVIEILKEELGIADTLYPRRYYIIGTKSL